MSDALVMIVDLGANESVVIVHCLIFQHMVILPKCRWLLSVEPDFIPCVVTQLEQRL